MAETETRVGSGTRAVDPEGHRPSLDRVRRSRPRSDVPGPRLPRLVQTLLGVVRPVEARLAMRERYGGVFRTNDSIAGELFHIAERDLIEQIFKWKPPTYNVGQPRQVMEPVTGP